MFLKFLFSKKAKPLKVGDIVMMKSPFLKNFPSVSQTSLLTVEKVEADTALVVFMNDNGNAIIKETLPLIALTKVA